MRQIGGGDLASNHYLTQETATTFCTPSARAQTQAETQGTGKGAGCWLTPPKNLYLKAAALHLAMFV